jgi:hypothetical protein
MRFLRPGSVEGVSIGSQDPLELLLLQDEQVIEALATHTAQEALTDGIGSRGLVRRCENLDATGLGNPCESHPKLAIVITDEVLRSHPISCGFSKRLGRPNVGGRACHAHMDHLPGVQFDNEEGEVQVEAEVGDWEKVARPDLLGMRVQEGLPGLSSWSCRAHGSHVLLNGALADMYPLYWLRIISACSIRLLRAHFEVSCSLPIPQRKSKIGMFHLLIYKRGKVHCAQDSFIHRTVDKLLLSVVSTPLHKLDQTGHCHLSHGGDADRSGP